MKKIVSFLSLLLCFPLAACHQHTAEGITYVMEESPTYSNHHYLPLLDIVQQFKDFHEEEITVRKNPYLLHNGEEEASKKWDEMNIKYYEIVRSFINELELEVLNLLNATITIDDYLVKVANVQDILFSAYINSATEYLIGSKTDVEDRIFPTSKKLFDFFMEDKEAFEGYEENNERVRLRAIKRFELLKQLTQTAIDLTDRNSLNETSITLISKLQLIAACECPDAIGGPYGLIERLIFDSLVDPSQKESAIKLKYLLKFNQIRQQYPSNVQFIQKLFGVLHHHTDSSIIPHFLQLIKDRPIKIWFLNSVQKPKKLQYSTDSHGNTRITSSLQLTMGKSALLLQEPPRQETYQATQATDKQLAYIEGRTKKQFTGHTPKANNKQQETSFTKVGQASKPTKQSLQLQGKPTKKQTRKPKKTILRAPSTPNASLKDRSVRNELTMDITSNPISATIGQALPLLPTIEEEEVIKEKERADCPAVSSSISLIPTIEITNVDISLSLPSDTEKEAIKFNVPMATEEPPLPTSKDSTYSLSSQQPIIPSKPAEKKAPSKKFIIVGKPAVTTTQAASPEKEKVSQKKEPTKKIASAAPLENSLLISQPASLQNTIQATPQYYFTMPRGLRSFHAEQLEKGVHPIIPYPKHQATINQLFDLETQCNITYRAFEVLWTANGGNIKQQGGSHCTLQFPQGANLFGIYKPHGPSNAYGKQAVGYLQAATLYIGLRPNNLELINL